MVSVNYVRRANHGVEVIGSQHACGADIRGDLTQPRTVSDGFMAPLQQTNRKVTHIQLRASAVCQGVVGN